MKIIQFIFIIGCLCAFDYLNGQVSGFVFRDFNGNGVKDNTLIFNEPFASDISVKAFNAANIQIGTTKTTNASGAYAFSSAEIASGTVVRIEFSGLTTGDYSSFNGTANGTNVQFTTAPNSAINYALNAPDDYWNNTAQADPSLLVVNNRRGGITGAYKDRFSILQINNSTNTPSVPSNNIAISIDTSKRPAIFSQTGSLFGLASQRKQQRVFAAAQLMRSVGFGPQGPGGIYIIDKSGSNFSLTGSFSLQGVIPSNGGASLDFGTVTRVTAPTTDDNYFSSLSANTVFGGSDGRDIDAFTKIGTISYGDIESDFSTDTIYTINLFQKKLIVLDASAITSTLNNATVATLAPFVKAYSITSLPGCPSPTGTGNNLRPFAIKIYHGKGYLGVVSDAMATQALSDLKGYVLEFDPKNISAGFTTVINFNFSSYGLYASTPFYRPWVGTYAQAGGTTTSTSVNYYPQPIIASIEFNEDGSMDLAIRDRWGSQGGNFEFNPISGATAHTQKVAFGDLLHACKTATGWALEGTAGSCDQPSTNTNGGAFGIGNTHDFGPIFSFNTTGKEWYADRSGDGQGENQEAGATKLMGSNRIVTTVIDPINAGQTTDPVYYSTQGVQWSNVNTGAKIQVARVEGAATLDKSHALGDVEFLIDAAPIQIGNRIWQDTDEDGMQDAGETTAGVPTGTTVTLRSPGVDGIYGNADDQTWTTTTDANGNYYFSTLSSSDNRKPASWVGVGSTILAGYSYRIEVDIPNQRIITTKDVSSNTKDNIDNDAFFMAGKAMVTFTASNTDHNFDIGFSVGNSIGDYVWFDANTNGIQDASESGLPNIKIVLYNSALNAVDSAITDATGHWIIKKIPPGTNYFVKYYGKNATHNWTLAHVNDLGGIIKTTGPNDSSTDSDSNPSGETLLFDLASNTTDFKIDAGLSSSIGLLEQKIISFTAITQHNTSLINLKLSQNYSATQVILQHSADGLAFTDVGIMRTDATNTDFVLEHLYPLLQQKNYYRAKIKTADNQITYSNIAIVVFELKGEIKIYPNPAHSNINISFDGEHLGKAAIVNVYNAYGKLMMCKRIVNCTPIETIAVSTFASGQYQFNIIVNSKLVTNKSIMVIK